MQNNISLGWKSSEGEKWDVLKMAELTVKIALRQKFWVRPLVMIAKAAGKMRLLKLHHVGRLSRFIADHGFNFEVRSCDER